MISDWSNDENRHNHKDQNTTEIKVFYTPQLILNLRYNSKRITNGVGNIDHD